MASQGNSGDVSATLGELERKLRELEHELARVGHPAAEAPLVPPPAPVAAPVPPAVAVPTPPTTAGAEPPVAAAAQSVAAAAAPNADERSAALERQLDDLRRYGQELHESAGRLLEAYRGALHEAETTPTVPPPFPTPVVPPDPAPAAPAPVESALVAAPIGQGQELPAEVLAHFEATRAAQPAPAPPAVPEPVARPGVVPAAPVPVTPVSVVPAAHAAAVDQTYLGAVTVDAGPFGDIGSLSAFEQALARVPGVRDVYVRGFQGQRAIVDVDFGAPTQLVRELAAVTTVPFVVNGADATGLVVTIQPVTADA